ncbi:hypothetical protein BWI97_27145, partial [Siphonobacter sp. BAB-5405]|uniref:hypothetical protein n=1 Tax=Siphonobacter sp. BAB-5405 TaxID=1864825 RepID=UPI000CBACF64
PLWKLSIPIPGVKENKVLVPIVKEGSDFVGKILYAIQGENKQWRYNLLDIKTFLREIISSDATKEKYLEQLVNFSFLILNQKVSGVTVPCSMGTNITQLNEVTIKQLKSAKTTECVTVSGWDGYCMWGGTVDNPYQYFNGCQGTYISTQVCYDNPDAFWAHYTGQALGLNTGVGGPPPPAGEDFTLPGVTYDANQIGSQVDCSSFNFVRTTSA